MLLSKWVLGILVLGASFQPLFAQTARTQINIADKPNKFDLAQASGFDFGEVSNLTHAGMNSVSPKVIWSDRSQAAPNNDLCYSLRVYSFTRKDDEAPQMTGSTTCTPAHRAVPRSIGGTPKARYVPQ